MNNKFTSRKFNQEDYDKYDSLAKDKMVEFLEARGHRVKKIEEDFNHDLVTIKNGREYYFELEMTNYSFTCEDDYRFPKVSFLGRKERLHSIKPFYYVIIHEDSALVAHSSVIFQELNREQIEIKSGPRKGFDEVFRIEKDLVKFFKLK